VTTTFCAGPSPLLVTTISNVASRPTYRSLGQFFVISTIGARANVVSVVVIVRIDVGSGANTPTVAPASGHAGAADVIQANAMGTPRRLMGVPPDSNRESTPAATRVAESSTGSQAQLAPMEHSPRATRLSVRQMELALTACQK